MTSLAVQIVLLLLLLGLILQRQLIVLEMLVQLCYCTVRAAGTTTTVATRLHDAPSRHM